MNNCNHSFIMHYNTLLQLYNTLKNKTNLQIYNSFYLWWQLFMINVSEYFYDALYIKTKHYWLNQDLVIKQHSERFKHFLTTNTKLGKRFSGLKIKNETKTLCANPTADDATLDFMWLSVHYCVPNNNLTSRIRTSFIQEPRTPSTQNNTQCYKTTDYKTCKRKNTQRYKTALLHII